MPNNVTTGISRSRFFTISSLEIQHKTGSKGDATARPIPSAGRSASYLQPRKKRDDWAREEAATMMRGRSFVVHCRRRNTDRRVLE